MPVASGIAAIVGAVLFGWRWIAAFFRKVFGAVTGRRESLPDATLPPAAASHAETDALTKARSARTTAGTGPTPRE